MNSAATLAQRQLDAYNQRDLDAFLACWADDACIFEFPDRLLARGRAQIADRHAQRFTEPDLFGRLVSRIVMGDTVIDQEVVTRNFPEGKGTLEVVAIYHMRNHLIASAWFLVGEKRIEFAAAPAAAATPA